MDETLKKLTPEAANAAINFIRSSSVYFSDNGIPKMDWSIEEFEKTNYAFKLAVQDFVVIVEKIHEGNENSLMYLGYMNNPKMKKNSKNIRAIFAYVLKAQIKHLRVSLKELEKLKNDMNSCATRMNAAVVSMKTAFGKASGMLLKRKREFNR